MNREIKFRGKRKDLINNEWYYGYLIIEPNGSFWMDYFIGGCRHTVELVKESVGQYTGLSDEFKKRVYEGDILLVSYYNHTGKNTKLIQEVYYLEESGCFCVRTVGKEVAPIENDRNNVPLSWTSHPNNIKRLGNIHENKELIN